MAETIIATDPEQIARLDAASKADAERTARLDAAANSNNRTTGDTVAGYGNAVLGGINQGIAHLPGLPVDMYNLAGNITAGRFPAWAADKVGLAQAADAIRKYGYHDIQTGSGQWFNDLLKKAGIGYDALTPGEQNVKDMTSGLTTAGLTGALTGPLGGLIGGEATPALTAGVNQGVAGLGGVVGGKVARAANDATGNLLPEPLVDFAGSLAGGKIASGTANRTALYEKPDIMLDADAAGVPLYFPSDVGGKGVVSSYLNSLADRLGAKNYSQSKAADTQQKLGQSIEGQLTDPNNPYGGTLQQQGAQYQSSAQRTLDALKADTSNAYAELAKVVPGNSPVATSKSSQVVNDMNNRAGGNTFISNLIANPTFQRFSDLPNNPTLTWDQMNLLRQETGAAMKNPNLSSSEQGQAAQLYGAVMDDMRAGASQASPTLGLEKFELANRKARENNAMADGILDNVVKAPAPETIPGYLTGQVKLGDTRLQGLMQGLTDAEKGGLGKALLLNAGRNAEGEFDPDVLAKFFNRLSPEATDALTIDPSARNAMGGFSRLYDATAQSRAAANGKPQTDPGAWMAGLTGGGGLLAGEQYLQHTLTPEHLGMAGGLGGGLAAAYPPFNAGLARAALPTGLATRMTSPLTGDMITPNENRLGVATGSAAMFPDTYSPQPAPAQPPAPANSAELGNMDRASASAYIATKVPPQIASEVTSGNDAQYKASLFNLMMDPEYRNKLFDSKSDE